MDLKGARVIVTGASSGIGRATAIELARAGAHVVLASRRRPALEDAAREVAAFGTRCLAVPTDVSDRAQVQALVDRPLGALGGVDVLVNNAGLGLDAAVADGSLDHVRRLWEVNFFGVLYCIQAVVPSMRARGRGVIVNVSSVAGRIATPYGAAYAATKAALIALSDALRLELEELGVRVVCVLPGYTATEFHHNKLRELATPSLPRAIRSVPARKVAQRIVRAVVREERTVYVTAADRVAVLLKELTPGLVDWGLRRLWSGPRRPQSVPPAGSSGAGR